MARLECEVLRESDAEPQASGGWMGTVGGLMDANQRGGTATVVSGVRETRSSWEKPFTVTLLSILVAEPARGVD
jgi:hypothetical protein